MAGFGVPRRYPGRYPGANDNDPRPLNWRRGLLRVWLLISIAWVMGWILYFIMNGIQGGFRTVGDFLEIPVVLFGPPIALLIFGAAARWAFRGFRAEDEK